MKRIVVLFALVLTTTGFGFAAPPAKPKLVVGIVIDQFRYDYLERFADLFGEGGFRRLMQEGAVFTDAQYLHSATVTAVGHSYDTNVPVILWGPWFVQGRSSSAACQADIARTLATIFRDY